MFDLKIVLKIEKEVPEYKYQRSQSSFLHDKRNQAEISGDLMSERKECVRKVKYLNEKFKSKKEFSTTEIERARTNHYHTASMKTLLMNSLESELERKNNIK